MPGDQDELAPVVRERIVERDPRPAHAGQPVQPLLDVAIQRRETVLCVRGGQTVQLHQDCNMTAWINVKMAVVPPIPSARVRTAVTVKMRAALNCRSA